VSGCVGPRQQGYLPNVAMSSAQAADYHATQVAQLASARADLVTAFTLCYAEEAAGPRHELHAVRRRTALVDPRLSAERVPPLARAARRRRDPRRRQPGRAGARRLARASPTARVQVIGGCCRTDVRHVRAMARTLDLPPR
jgi:S-methylmethionine-dependent homocysteine/selenocysteine methylase